eukprot:COSAG04_NODE_1_length_58448_cov_23.476478_25_plen_133_part_00
MLLSLLGVYLLSTQPPGAADDDSASDPEDDDAGEPQSTARLLTIFLAGLRRSRRLGCVPAYAALETPPGSPQPAFADYDPWSDKRGGEGSEEEEEVELLVTEDDESGPLSVRSPGPRPLEPAPGAEISSTCV